MKFALLVFVLVATAGCAGLEVGAGGHAGLSGEVSGFGPSISMKVILAEGLRGRYDSNGGEVNEYSIATGFGGSTVLFKDDKQGSVGGLMGTYTRFFPGNTAWVNTVQVGASAVGDSNAKQNFGVGGFSGIGYGFRKFMISAGPDIQAGLNPYVALGAQVRLRIIWAKDN